MKLLKLITYACILLMIAMTFAGCSTVTSGNIKQDVPDDFNFSLTYGTYGKQKVDTFNDVVVKDLVKDGVLEADIALTENEMKEIYNEMININIMVIADFEGYKECITEPPSYTAWNIQMNGKTQSLHYSTFCEYPEDLLALVHLEETVHDFIRSKNEYKELPEADGSYE